MKKISIIVGVVLVIIISGYVWIQKSSTLKVSNVENTQPQSIVSTTSDTIVTSQNTSVSAPKIFVQINNALDSLKAFDANIPISFMAPNASTTISFKGEIEQVRNPGSNFYFNQENIGSVEGVGIRDGLFAPDNSKFAFIDNSICGAGCYDFSIYVADFVSKKLTQASLPETKTSYVQGKDGVKYQAQPYIESLVWKDSNTLELVTYQIVIQTDAIYRVTAKSTWDYAIGSGKYTKVI